MRKRLESNREYKKKYRATLNSWIVETLTEIRRRASDARYESDIDKDYLVGLLVEKCPVFGFPLLYRRDTKGHPNLASVDRIDSSRGYLKGNVQILSFKANMIKSDAAKDELISFAKWVLNGF